MRLVRAPAVALVAVLALLAWPAAARAHDGDMVFAVSGDGAAGFSVLATWEVDDHPVEAPLRLSAMAVAGDGTRVGPLVVQPTGEGRGYYALADALPAGTWEVTVTSSDPAGSGTAQVVAAAGEVSAALSGGSSDGSSPWPWVAGIAAVLLLLAAAVLRPRRAPVLQTSDRSHRHLPREET